MILNTYHVYEMILAMMMIEYIIYILNSYVYIYSQN